jgi:hypothetical protein
MSRAPSIHLHVNRNPNKEVVRQLRQFGQQLSDMEILLMTALQRLEAEVAQQKTLTASLVTLVTGLAATIRANAGNEAALNRLADELDASQPAMESALLEGTGITEPAPTPTPTPSEEV